eukprot:5394874-Pyramimonas_sp.AAC.1
MASHSLEFERPRAWGDIQPKMQLALANSVHPPPWIAYRKHILDPASFYIGPGQTRHVASPFVAWPCPVQVADWNDDACLPTSRFAECAGELLCDEGSPYRAFCVCDPGWLGVLLK